MSKGVFMKKEDYEKLKEKFEQETRITEDNIQEKSIQLSNLYSIMLNLYTRELKNLKIKKIEMERIYGEIYLDLKKNGKDGIDSSSKADADIYINSDQRYYPLKIEYAQLQSQVDYLEKTLSILDNLGFRIKNYIDIVKIRKGLM